MNAVDEKMIKNLETQDVEIVKTKVARKLLVFGVGEQKFALDGSKVSDIVKYTKETKVPQVPNYVIGVINLRGNIVPLVDLRVKFHSENIVYGDRSCMIIYENDNGLVGFVVDKVLEVVDVLEQNISKAKKISENIDGQVEGLFTYGDETVMILNV